jgi:hypothetical protein
MPKPRLYHHFLRARITREQRQAIQEYAKCHGLRWGEAVRELIEQALDRQRGRTTMIPSSESIILSWADPYMKTAPGARGIQERYIECLRKRDPALAARAEAEAGPKPAKE